MTEYMSADVIIDIRNLSFLYSRDIPVLDNVDLQLCKHESVCILGPNGGGKTTLLKIILGLLKPSSGSINVLGSSPANARRKIGYVPQYSAFDPLFPVNVMDVVLMGRVERHICFSYSREDRQCAMDVLEEIKAADLYKRSFAELSGGQRQRVLIARALVAQPEVLLLDEPTANVDPAMEEKIFSILYNLNKRMTILTVSHDLGFVSSIFKSVVCVNKKLVKHPTTALTGDMIQEIYGRSLRMVHHHNHCECPSSTSLGWKNE